MSLWQIITKLRDLEQRIAVIERRLRFLPEQNYDKAETE